MVRALRKLQATDYDLNATKPPLLFCDRQSRIDQVDGISADHDLERSWLDDLVHVAIQERELLEAERKFHGFCFARVERNPAEAAQFFYGARYGADFVADVELNNFVTADFASVRYVHADAAWCLRDRSNRAPDGGCRI